MTDKEYEQKIREFAEVYAAVAPNRSVEEAVLELKAVFPRRKAPEPT